MAHSTILLPVVFSSNLLHHKAKGMFYFPLPFVLFFLPVSAGSSSFQDERYSKYIGKLAIVPLTFGRHVPIISDKVELYIVLSHL